MSKVAASSGAAVHAAGAPADVPSAGASSVSQAVDGPSHAVLHDAAPEAVEGDDVAPPAKIARVDNSTAGYEGN